MRNSSTSGSGAIGAQSTQTAVGGMAGSNLTFGVMEDLGVAIITGHYSEANPFPNELTTPPVTKIYLAPQKKI